MSRGVLPRGEVLVGDAANELAALPDATVDMVLTSPPYFRLRDYAAEGQLGLEQHVEDWVAALQAVTREMQRVLVPTGSLWLNLGDSFSTHHRQGAARKSLLLGPERLALALLRDGWRLRNKIVWHKTNHMPTSATDRLGCAWEALYLFVQRPRYFFDLDAVRVVHRSRPPKPTVRPFASTEREPWRGPNADDASGLARLKALGRVGHPLGKNPGDVWPLPAGSYRGGHHATFPVALAASAIRAGCPEARCRRCQTPWRRPVSRWVVADGQERATRQSLAPTCGCRAPAEPGLVLDPFFGVGTTALGAIEHDRDWLGIELNPEYAAEAIRRIAAYQPGQSRSAKAAA